MGNKKFHPTYNRGKQEKELLNRLQKQQKLRVFLATNFEGGRHEMRVNLINEIEKENMK